MNNTITLSQLITRLAETASVDNNTSRRFLRAFFDTIAGALARGESVIVKGIGTFKPVGDMTDSNQQRVRFVPDIDLAAELNRPFEMFSAVELAQGVEFDLEAEGVPQLPDVKSKDEAATDTVGPEEDIVQTTTAETVTPEYSFDETEKADEVLLSEEPEQPVRVVRVVETTSFEPDGQPEEATQPEDASTYTKAPEAEHEAEPVHAAEPYVSTSVKSETSTIEPDNNEPDIEAESQTRSNIWLWAGIGFVAAIAIGYAAAVLYTPIGGGYDVSDEDYSVEQALVTQAPADSLNGITEVPLPAAEVKPAEVPTETVMPVTPVAETQAVADIEPIYDSVEISLSQLARKHYRQALYWVFIYEANRDIVSDPNKIKPGTKVLIPDISTFPGETAEETRKIAKQKQTEILNKYNGR